MEAKGETWPAPVPATNGHWLVMRPPWALTTPEVAIDVDNLGMILRDLGDLAAARAALQRAVAICTVCMAPTIPVTHGGEPQWAVRVASAKLLAPARAPVVWVTTGQDGAVAVPPDREYQIAIGCSRCSCLPCEVMGGPDRNGGLAAVADVLACAALR